jgi:hypothetical protein
VEPTDDLDPSQAVEPVGPRQPWDKRPDESQRAFDAFVLFRDDEQRRFKNVAEKLSCSPQNIFQWSSKYNWRLRCDAFDLEQDRQQRVAFARIRVRMRERHLSLAVALGGIAAHGVREWQQRIEQRLPLNLTPEQLALLTKCATELERSTLGMDQDHQPTEIRMFFGTHKYKDEQGGDDGDGEPMLAEDFEAQQYARLSPEERVSLDSWRDPPKPKALKEVN